MPSPHVVTAASVGRQATLLATVSGPIQKKSSMSDDSSSEMMELDETALLAEPNLEQNLRRLREEERLLLEQQAAMEAGGFDDIAALENQDALRLNHLQQAELQKQLAAQAARQAQRQEGAGPRRERRRATCTVRVNNLHAADAIETDV